MRVSVSLCAVLRDSCDARDRPSAEGWFEIEFVEGTTVQDAVQELGLPAGMESIACVNGRPRPEGTPLADGDRLYVFVPVSGG
jgi:sulfur carrier protein ThiS